MGSRAKPGILARIHVQTCPEIPGSEDPGIPRHGSWGHGIPGSWDPTVSTWDPGILGHGSRDPGPMTDGLEARPGGRWTLALSKHPPGHAHVAGYPGHARLATRGMPRPSACLAPPTAARTADLSPTAHAYTMEGRAGTRYTAGRVVGGHGVPWVPRGYPGYTMYTSPPCLAVYRVPAVRPWCTRTPCGSGPRSSSWSHWLSLGSSMLLVANHPAVRGVVRSSSHRLPSQTSPVDPVETPYGSLVRDPYYATTPSREPCQASLTPFPPKGEGGAPYYQHSCTHPWDPPRDPRDAIGYTCPSTARGTLVAG